MPNNPCDTCSNTGFEGGIPLCYHFEQVEGKTIQTKIPCAAKAAHDRMANCEYCQIDCNDLERYDEVEMWFDKKRDEFYINGDKLDWHYCPKCGRPLSSKEE